MSMAGIAVDPEVKTLYEDIKINKTYRGFTMSVTSNAVTVDKKLDLQSATPFEDLVAEFGKDNAKFAVFQLDVTYTDGRVRSRLALVIWYGPNCNPRLLMYSATTKDAVAKALTGLAFQCNGQADVSRPWILDTGLDGVVADFFGRPVQYVNGQYSYK